jgi:hypothetical protein
LWQELISPIPADQFLALLVCQFLPPAISDQAVKQMIATLKTKTIVVTPTPNILRLKKGKNDNTRSDP